MLKTLYKRYEFIINLIVVMYLLVLARMLDWIAWTPPSPDRLHVILIRHLCEFIAFFPIIFLIISGYTRALKRKNYVLLVVLIIILTVFGPTLVKFLSNWLDTIVSGKVVAPVTIDVLKKFTPGCSIVILFLTATFYLTHLKNQYIKQKEAAHNAEALAKEVQLKMLRYQINPHFLFNVLNTIYALIDENAGKAKKLVIGMSEYYRYTLNKQEQTISVEKEVAAAAKYLEIQKTRFEEKFEYEISVDNAISGVLIPSFVIHLLIENAVKYGTKSNSPKLIVSLVVKLINKNLLISVSNTGKMVEAIPAGSRNTDGTGNGIENIKNRLALFYNNSYSFSLQEENGWVSATIEINNIHLPSKP